MVSENSTILIIAPEYPPHNIGGGGIAFKNIAETLVQKGSEVEVLAGDFTLMPNDEPYTETRTNIPITRLPLTKPLIPILKAKTPPTKSSKDLIKNKLENNKYDFAIVFGSFEMLSVYASKQLYNRNIPYIVHSHGYFIPSNYSPLLRLVFKVYEKLFLLPMLKNSKQVFSVNPDQIMPVQTEYLPNGINSEEFSNIDTPLDIRKQNHIPNENFILFSIGRLHEHKGFQFVIEAIKDLPNITYIIAGLDDGYLTKLKQLSKGMNNVIFTGQLDHDQKKSYYQQSDLHLLTSTEESFGLVILEAMVFGLPSIVSRVGGMKYLVKDGVNGMIVESGDVNRIKETIIKLSNDKILLASLGKECKKEVLNYSWDYVANYITDFFNKDENK